MKNDNWREEIEDIFEMHGPYVALQYIDKEYGNALDGSLDSIRASIYFRWQEYEKAEELIEKTKQKIKELSLEDQLVWYTTAVGVFIHKQQYVKAFTLVRDAVAKFPEDIMLLNQLALVNYKLGHKPYVKSYEELMAKHPMHPAIMVAYAELLFQEHKDIEAEKLLHKVLEVDENNIKALDMMGYICAEKQQDHKALDYFVKSSEIWPFNLNRLLSLCEIAMLTRDYANAEKAYRYALKYYPNNGALNRGFAILLLQIRGSDKEEMLAYAKKGVELLPNLSKSHLVLAYAYAHNELWKNAQETIKEVYKYPPIEGDVKTLERQIQEKLSSSN